MESNWVVLNRTKETLSMNVSILVISRKYKIKKNILLTQRINRYCNLPELVNVMKRLQSVVPLPKHILTM